MYICVHVHVYMCMVCSGQYTYTSATPQSLHVSSMVHSHCLYVFFGYVNYLQNGCPHWVLYGSLSISKLCRQRWYKSGVNVNVASYHIGHSRFFCIFFRVSLTVQTFEGATVAISKAVNAGVKVQCSCAFPAKTAVRVWLVCIWPRPPLCRGAAIEMPFIEIEFSNLEFYERLGSGSAGTVYRALWKMQGKIVAVKKLLQMEKEVSYMIATIFIILPLQWEFSGLSNPDTQETELSWVMMYT